MLVSVACALPGTFLVLRKMSMMSDSITHTILLGIVLAFFITHDLSSPLLLLGATLMGVITVWLTETLHRTKLVSEDASIGIIFPLLFSIAIILITRYAGAVHLDTDSVLLGELAFAPFNRMVVFGVDIGAKSIYTSLLLVGMNLLFILLFYKELQLGAFDPMLAAALGFSPALIHYSLMAIVSFTTVGAFESVGSVLVVAFMIGPPITAWLLTDRLHTMLLLSGIIGMVNSLLGYQLASWWDVSIAGSMAGMTGLVFLVTLLLAPKRGLISVLIRRSRQRIDFAQRTMLFHLAHHAGGDREAAECGVDTLHAHLHWDKRFAADITGRLIRSRLVEREGDLLRLTPQGHQRSRQHYDALFGEG